MGTLRATTLFAASCCSTCHGCYPKTWDTEGGVKTLSLKDPPLASEPEFRPEEWFTTYRGHVCPARRRTISIPRALCRPPTHSGLQQPTSSVLGKASYHLDRSYLDRKRIHASVWRRTSRAAQEAWAPCLLASLRDIATKNDDILSFANIVPFREDAVTRAEGSR